MAERDSWAVGNTSDRKVGAEDARRAMAALMVPGHTPVSSLTGLRLGGGNPGRVTATGTPGPSVVVEEFQGFLDNSGRPGTYIVTLDGNKTIDLLTANPAHASNQRNDLIVAQQSDADYGDADRNFLVRHIVGTPSGSPTDPVPSGSPNYVTLARVRVTAGATTITNAMIDDLRPAWTVALGGIKPVRGTTDRTALPLLNSQVIIRLDRSPIWTEMCDGTAWRVMPGAVTASTADRDSAITSPYNGQLVISTDTGAVWERVAGAWVALPQGFMGETKRATTDSGIGTTETVLDTVTISNVISGRRYKVTWMGLVAVSVAPPPFPTLRLRYAAGATVTSAGTLMVDPAIEISTINRPIVLVGTFTAPSSGQFTVGFTCNSGGGGNTVTVTGGATKRLLLVEGLGG